MWTILSCWCPRKTRQKHSGITKYSKNGISHLFVKLFSTSDIALVTQRQELLNFTPLNTAVIAVEHRREIHAHIFCIHFTWLRLHWHLTLYRHCTFVNTLFCYRVVNKYLKKGSAKTGPSKCYSVQFQPHAQVRLQPPRGPAAQGPSRPGALGTAHRTRPLLPQNSRKFATHETLNRVKYRSRVPCANCMVMTLGTCIFMTIHRKRLKSRRRGDHI